MLVIQNVKEISSLLITVLIVSSILLWYDLKKKDITAAFITKQLQY